MATGDVREHDVGAMRAVVAALWAPPSRATPAPDAPWGTPVVLLSRDPVGPGVRWAALGLLRDLLGCDELGIDACDTTLRERRFGQGIGVEGPEYLQIVRRCPESPANDPRVLDPWYEEAEAYYWDNYDTLPCGHAHRTGDWDTVLDAPLAFRDPLYEWCDEREPNRCRGALATAPFGPGRQLQLQAFRRDHNPFGDRELGFLELLKPHFVEAFRRSCATEAPLTTAQQRVLALVRDGRTNRQVARDLGISEATVRTHLEHIYAALGVRSRLAAVAAAFGAEDSVPAQRRDRRDE